VPAHVTQRPRIRRIAVRHRSPGGHRDATSPHPSGCRFAPSSEGRPGWIGWRPGHPPLAPNPVWTMVKRFMG